MIPVQMSRGALNLHKKIRDDIFKRINYLLEVIGACVNSREPNLLGYTGREKQSYIGLLKLWVRGDVRAPHLKKQLAPARLRFGITGHSFVGDVLSNLDDILFSDPSNLVSINQKFIANHPGYAASIGVKLADMSPIEKSISETVRLLFRYDEHIESKTSGSWDGKSFCELQGVNSCPYCNRSYIQTVNSTKAWRPQLDHYYPKSKFPILQMSIYNLVPVCGQCNFSKSDTVFASHRMNPYSYTNSIVKFSVDAVVAKLNTCSDSVDVDLRNSDGTTLSGEAKAFYSSLGIETAYKYHGREAADILAGAILLNNCRSLKSQFNISKDFLFRILIGDDALLTPHQRRTLSKMKSDIADQINLNQLIQSLP